MTLYHATQYTPASKCEVCDGVLRHEKWCLVKNERVCYAFEICVRPEKLTEEDKLRLRSLGVAWTKQKEKK